MVASEKPQSLKRTPLYDLHVEMGGKMVPFAGYDMPVQFPAGVLKEHLHTRASAGLFDVSHMGQAFLVGTQTIDKRLQRGRIHLRRLGNLPDVDDLEVAVGAITAFLLEHPGRI